MYLGMTPHALRVEEEKGEKKRKMKRVKWEKKMEKKINIVLERLKMGCFWLFPQNIWQYSKRFD